ncbi:MAG TPA: segregation/condensation protein A [Erysipelotrichaceae bacterium]|jgi:segregation and condensation protein A|nr:segregation/condensation protein A [Erysipelotrichaceae bacterium]HQA85707.1 segregation/condensation protein A [Erysipelotrichaceae bacterium]
MEFFVTIEQFEGPLDLMLHLIKEKELDLFDLDINILTQQYVEYIHAMEQMKLDVASEYLLELATLIEYKSKKLLPNEAAELDDNYQQQQEVDLVNRLIEYKKFKEVSIKLDDLYQERNLKFDKPQSEIVNQWIDINENYESTSVYELIKAMNRCLKRFQLSQPYEVNITQKRISIEDRKKQLKINIKKFNEVFALSNTMYDCRDLYEVVITFLAILDLVNENVLSFTIKDDEVYFKKV